MKQIDILKNSLLLSYHLRIPYTPSVTLKLVDVIDNMYNENYGIAKEDLQEVIWNVLMPIFIAFNIPFNPDKSSKGDIIDLYNLIINCDNQMIKLAIKATGISDL